MWKVATFYLSLILVIKGLNCQVPGGTYEKISVESYLAQNGAPYGIDVKDAKPTPPYYETIWGAISVPPIITPCQFIQPITITVGNINRTDPVAVEFSCDTGKLGGTSKVQTQYGALSISNVVALSPLCETIATVLNEITPTAVQTYAYTNLTYYITNDMVESFIVKFPQTHQSLDGQGALNWLSQHIYSETWYDIRDDLGLTSELGLEMTIPIKYKIFLPTDVLPGKNIVGSNGDHYFVDGFNVTILNANSQDQSQESAESLWVPKSGMAGFIPSITPTYQMKVIPYYSNVTAYFNNAAITWGQTNLPLSVTPVRVIPPSRLPKQAKSGQKRSKCSSNYDFYFPLRPYTMTGNLGSNEDPRDLTLLIRNKSDPIFQRNTLKGMGFFNKFIIMNNPGRNGILQDTAAPSIIIEENFIGGCFFNGTFPLTHSIENKGFSEQGRCSSEQLNTSARYKTPFYPPPKKYDGYFQPALDHPATQTLVIQTISYTQNGGGPSKLEDSKKTFIRSYPGISVVSQIFYGIFIQGPRISWQSPFFHNSNNPLVPEGSFYAISPQYIEKMFGTFNTPGGGASCRAARMIPMPTEMSDVKITWQCYTSTTPVSLLYSTTTLKDQAYETCMEANTPPSTLANCLTAEKTLPSTLRTATHADNSWSTRIESREYSTTTPLLFIQNNTSPHLIYGYSPTGWWIETITYPNNYHQWFLRTQTCAFPPEIPIFPTSTPQVFSIKSVPKPWDHINTGHHFSTIPYMSGNSSFSFEVQISDASFFPTVTDFVKFESQLLCEGHHSIQLETVPSEIRVQEMLPPETIIVSAIVKPFTIFSEQNVNCFLVFSAFPASMRQGATVPTAFGTLANQIPTAPAKGVGEYIYFLSADMPPQMDEFSVLAPNPGKTSASDTLYLQIPRVVFPTPVQSSVFPSLGLFASSDPVVSSTSRILIIGDQQQVLQQSLRLPATEKVWYVFLKGTTPSNSGCLIPCDKNLKDHYITPYCSYGNGPVCPSQKIVMGDQVETKEQIMELIAAATHPLSYLSLFDGLQLGISLFSQPSSQTLVWNDYFDVLFEMLVENPKTPAAADFSASKITVFGILNMILRRALENPKLQIDTIRPFNTILNNTLIAECANSPGFKFLLLETIDLLAATNGWEFISSNSQYLQMFELILQSIGNRLSFSEPVRSEFKWEGPHSKIVFQSKTFAKQDLKTGVSFDIVNIPPLTFSNSIEFQLVESIYMIQNPKYFDHNLAKSYWIPSCPNNIHTISVSKYPNELIKSSIHKSISSEDQVIIPVLSTTFYACSIDYYLINIPTPVSFNVDIELDIHVNTTNLECVARRGGRWDGSLCQTFHRYNEFNTRKSQIQCLCTALSSFALRGTVSPLNKYQNDTKPWPGFDGDFGVFIPNVSEIRPMLGNISSGFIYLQGDSANQKRPDSSLEDGQVGRYSVTYRREKNSTAETFGLIQQQSAFNNVSYYDYDFLYSWEPKSHDSNSNITIAH
ncbi:large secreted protein [Cryptosporidium canis]|uniref:Large secreted protein n=1 Tax=Cryptosporidium canis TaxID=195482 RepID=A0ABQ8PA69_9CRYT|nr:large secreted protein [Cryptosporidium canis]KAJ1614307.1 large secreted protein [Cryptosporidium canis]